MNIEIVYVAALDSDSFNYTPVQETKERVEKHNRENPDDTLTMYETFKEAEDACDHLNSL